MSRIAVLALVTLIAPDKAWAQGGLSTPQEPSFKSGVELVTVFAVVKDRQGRLMTGLTSRDFEIVDAGHQRRIVDCRVEQGPITVRASSPISAAAWWFLRGLRRFEQRYDTCSAGWSRVKTRWHSLHLTTTCTRYKHSRTFTATSSSRLDALQSYGNTSLYDAIWQVGAELAGRTGSRSAVIVITDGQDNNSRLSAAEAARVVRLVDVPVTSSPWTRPH